MLGVSVVLLLVLVFFIMCKLLDALNFPQPYLLLTYAASLAFIF